MIISTFLVVGGIGLRFSSNIKTALGYFHKTRSNFNTLTQWKTENLGSEIQQASVELLNAIPNIELPGNFQFNQMKNFLNSLYHLVGPKALRAISRRAVSNIPWYESTLIAQTLPVTVSLPLLSSWSDEKIHKKLRNLQNVSNFNRDQLNNLSSGSSFSIFYPGDTIFEQHSNKNEIVLLLDGCVSIEKTNFFLRSIITTLNAEDLIGEIGFHANGKRTATVRALLPTLILKIYQQDFETITQEDNLANHPVSIEYDTLNHDAQLNQLFSDFHPSIRSRILLESQWISLDRGQTFWLETEECRYKTIVFLSGEGILYSMNDTVFLYAGHILGIEECCAVQKLNGQIWAKQASTLLLIPQNLILESITAILLLKEIYKIHPQKRSG